MPPRNHRLGAAPGDRPRATPLQAARGLPITRWLSIARWLSVASLSCLLVVVILVPSDSVAVELGGALPLLPLAVLAWVTAAMADSERPPRAWNSADRLLNVLVWALAAWIGIAAIAVAGVGNLRGATNEVWWWVTAAAIFTAARRAIVNRHASLTSSILLVSLACGLAVQAAHQQWVTLPADRAKYQADPEEALQESGIFAPPGSPQRELFESRLYGGGPTATFALTNSLAAVLLIGVVLAGGMLAASLIARRVQKGRIQESQLQEGAARADRGAKPANPWRSGGAAGIAVILCGIALLWTESRSAFIGLAAAGAVAALYWVGRSHSMRATAIAAVGVGALVLGSAAGWILLRPELLRGAPRSLQYRIEYWQATLDMVADRPWFGAGPGNFQERYVTYRLDQASESIADPHNWLMETLAAGGVPALLLLLAAIAVGFKIIVGVRQVNSADRIGEPPHPNPLPQTDRDGRWGWLFNFSSRSIRGRGDRKGVTTATRVTDAEFPLNPAPRRWAMTSGAVIGFAGVLFAWISQSYLPNFDALVLSLLAAVGMAIALYPLATAASPLEALGHRGAGEGAVVKVSGVRWLGGAAAVAVAVHLLAAGGWTVPGVATPWLVLIVVALGDPASRTVNPGQIPATAVQAREQMRRTLWVIGFGVMLLGAWLWTAWLPTQRAAEHSARGKFALQSGRPAMAVEAYQTAAAADPWDPQPLVREADLYRWAIVRGVDSATVRGQWENAWEAAIARNPAASGLRQGRAAHRLHFFQRWGNQQDLKAARQDLLDAIARDRSNVEIAAQLTVVEAALENREAAQQWRERTETLAAAGSHTDRQLTIVQVLPAEWIGERAETEPWLVPAAERLGSQR